MGPQTQEFMVLLAKIMHQSGIVDGKEYIRAIRNTFNEPNANFERADYQYLQGLANFLEKEMRHKRNLPGCPAGLHC
jgi:hypothetical protein